jgi:hypothetical protein
MRVQLLFCNLRVVCRRSFLLGHRGATRFPRYPDLIQFGISWAGSRATSESNGPDRNPRRARLLAQDEHPKRSPPSSDAAFAPLAPGSIPRTRRSKRAAPSSNSSMEQFPAPMMTTSAGTLLQQCRERRRGSSRSKYANLNKFGFSARAGHACCGHTDAAGHINLRSSWSSEATLRGPTFR